MGATGLEPPHKTPGNTDVSGGRGAFGGAPGDNVETGAGDLEAATGTPDADLARVLAAWPTLPVDARRAVLAIIDGHAAD
ncbi:MAG: hypothetical protein DYG94_07140 [Leptolyngbya sp. PLA3]|nr:hypothetical protein [Leptolyngbya sp. PL-A3]